MKVAIYTRVSTDHQIDKDSLPMQRNDLIAYARLILGTEDYEVFEDAGYSGKNVARPGFQAMMARTRRGEFTHILVWKIDRISRNLLDFAQMYAELKKLGVAFVSKNERFDTSSAMGEAMLKIILVFAELERNMTSERVTATMISRASNGIWNGGQIPYGYTYDTETKSFSICEDEAQVVRIMHDRYEELRSLVWLCNELTARGYRTRRNYVWTPSVVGHILASYFYCGAYQYNVHAGTSHTAIKDQKEWVYKEDHHPAIVSKEQKERIIDILTYNDRGKRAGRSVCYSTHDAHIFSGLLQCNTCGKTLYSATRKNASGLKISLYSCPTQRSRASLCKQKGIMDFAVGNFVFNFILNMNMARKRFVNGMPRRDLEKILLSGEALSKVSGLTEDSIDSVYSILQSGVSGEVYTYTYLPVVSAGDHLATLKGQLRKQERAMQRLTDLFLYTESDMTEHEFVTRKIAIQDEIASLSAQIEKEQEGNPSQNDIKFVRLASEFIITRQLSQDSTITFKSLMESTDSAVLADFTKKVIRSIIVDGDNILEINFTNGLTMAFRYKKTGV